MVARTNRARPAGFTLIELLVVIAIIGVLMGLLLAAVMRVSQVGDEAKVKSELRQLDTVINGYKAKYGVDHLPAFGSGPSLKFQLRKVYPVTSTAGNPGQDSFEFQYLIRIFPGVSSNKNLSTGAIDFDPNNIVPPIAWGDYDNNQIMVFFLTGGEVTKYVGFSNNARNPFDRSDLNNRKGKFFDIPDNRIQVVNGQTTGRYLDPWGTPYVYMAPYDGKQYPMPSAAGDVIPVAVLQAMGVVGQPTGINPFRTLVSSGPPAVYKALKDGSFQIVSAGKNKVFGRGSFYTPTGLNPYSAGNPPYTDKDPGGDDFSNFNNLKLSAPNN